MSPFPARPANPECRFSARNAKAARLAGVRQGIAEGDDQPVQTQRGNPGQTFSGQIWQNGGQ